MTQINGRVCKRWTVNVHHRLVAIWLICLLALAS